jgi:hypothetical protein
MRFQHKERALQAAEKLRKYVERSKIGGYKTINRPLRIAPRASWRDLFFAFRYKKSFSAACLATAAARLESVSSMN